MQKILTLLFFVFSFYAGMSQQNPSDAALTGKLVPKPLAKMNEGYLQGRVKGLNIPNANQAAGGTRIMIRCSPSIRTNCSPLFVVDGVVVPIRGLQDLNPKDVESIEVLKPASGNAIYGNDASNGVIIITTQKPTARIFIADSMDKKPVPCAFVQLEFNGGEYPRKTILADSLGYIALEKKCLPFLKTITASCVGYQGRILSGTDISHAIDRSILLSRKISLNQMVVVVVGSRISCGRGWTRCVGNWVKSDQLKSKSVQSVATEIPAAVVFPNPVKRLGTLHVRFNAASKEKGVLQFITLSGQQVYLQRQNFTGTVQDVDMPISQQLSAGLYLLVIKNDNGKMIAQQRVVVE